jgi:hypothetical protein
MVVVTSEGLGRVDDREGRSASGDCEGDSNKYEDFSHGRTSRKSTYNYTTRSPRAVTGMLKNYGLSATSRQVYGPPRLPRDGLAKMTPDTANAL